MNAEVLQTLEAAYPPGSDVDEILLEIGKKCVAEIEEDDPDVLSRIQQEISDLYSVLKYERDLEMGYHDPLEIDERDHMAKE